MLNIPIRQRLLVNAKAGILQENQIPVKFRGQKERLLNKILDESEHRPPSRELQSVLPHSFLITGRQPFILQRQ